MRLRELLLPLDRILDQHQVLFSILLEGRPAANTNVLKLAGILGWVERGNKHAIVIISFLLENTAK